MKTDKLKELEFYASSASLSIYLPTDKNGEIDTEMIVNEQDFIKNTLLSVDFRTKTKFDDNNN